MSQNPNVNALDGVHNYESIQKFEDTIDQYMQVSLVQSKTRRSDERNKFSEVENFTVAQCMLVVAHISQLLLTHIRRVLLFTLVRKHQTRILTSISLKSSPCPHSDGVLHQDHPSCDSIPAGTVNFHIRLERPIHTC